MHDARKTIRRIAYVMAGASILMFVVVFFFKFGVRDDSYPFPEAWDRGLVQGFLVVNGALLAIALGLLALRPWARWADCFWGVALAANALVTEAWHYGSIGTWSIIQAVLIASAWGWFSYRALFAPNVTTLFTGQRDV
jgi:hypothetical protein